MELSALPGTIEGFFDALLPALAQTAVLLTVVAVLLGRSAFRRLFEASLELTQGLDDMARNAFVKESGVLKLIPIGLLVALLVFAMGVDRLVRTVGNELPGRLYYSQPGLLVSSVPGETLAKLWTLYPGAEDEHMLHLVLEREVSAAELAGKNAWLPWKSHEETDGAAVRVVDASKFYLLLAGCALLLAPRLGMNRRRVVRGALGLACCIAVAVPVAIVNQLEAKRQSQWAQVDYVLASKIASGRKAHNRPARKGRHAEYEARLAAYLEHDREVFYLGR